MTTRKKRRLALLVKPVARPIEFVGTMGLSSRVQVVRFEEDRIS